MENKIEEIRDKYKNLKKNMNREHYETYAKIIVGGKLLKHMVYKLPNAIRNKKNDKGNAKKNSLYKNNSVLDYIEDPDFDYNKEVEEITNKIELKMEKTNKTINSIRQKMSVFYWIKKLIEKVKNRDVKLIESKNVSDNEKENERNFQKNRINFIENIKINENINVKRENANKKENEELTWNEER